MNDFSLALLGDGVFARFGDDCAELVTELSRLYSHSTFDISNHGLDGSRVGNALFRITNDYVKEGKEVRHLAYPNPGIVIVESCAHSQFWDGPEGLSEYRDLLRRVWDEVTRTTTARLLFYLAAPPPRDRFLEGIDLFQNTSKATRARFADGVAMFIDEARAIAQDEGWPFVDVGAEIEKLTAKGASARRFFDQNDNFYPSRLGYQVAAKVLVQTMDNQRFIEEKISK